MQKICLLMRLRRASYHFFHLIPWVDFPIAFTEQIALILMLSILSARQEHIDLCLLLNLSSRRKVLQLNIFSRHATARGAQWVASKARPLFWAKLLAMVGKKERTVTLPSLWNMVKNTIKSETVKKAIWKSLPISFCCSHCTCTLPEGSGYSCAHDSLWMKQLCVFIAVLPVSVLLSSSWPSKERLPLTRLGSGEPSATLGLHCSAHVISLVGYT